MNNGQKIIDFIGKNNLMVPMCAESDDHNIIMVWSGNSEEQLEALFQELKASEDISDQKTPDES